MKFLIITRCSSVALLDMPISTARAEDIAVPRQSSHPRYVSHELRDLIQIPIINDET